MQLGLERKNLWAVEGHKRGRSFYDEQKTLFSTGENRGQRAFCQVIISSVTLHVGSMFSPEQLFAYFFMQ